MFVGQYVNAGKCAVHEEFLCRVTAAGIASLAGPAAPPFSQSSTTPSCHWHASWSLHPPQLSALLPASLRSPGPLHRTFPSPAPSRRATGSHVLIRTRGFFF